LTSIVQSLDTLMSRQYQLAVYFSLRYMYRTTKLTIDYFINSA